MALYAPNSSRYEQTPTRGDDKTNPEVFVPPGTTDNSPRLSGVGKALNDFTPKAGFAQKRGQTPDPLWLESGFAVPVGGQSPFLGAADRI